MSSTLTGIRTIEDFELSDKVVFLRLDLNVPLNNNGEITDAKRIEAALPTIRYAMDKGAKLVLASHLGRPKSKEDFKKYSLEPVARKVGEFLNVEVLLVEDLRGDAPKALLGGLKKNQILLLENLRFDKDETQNGEDLAEAIAQYTDVYINDAFGASHRAHSSIVKLPEMIKNKGIGFLIKKEVEMLDRLLDAEDKPFVTILGGSKVSDKIGVIDNLIDKVDVFMVGGAMAYTFLAAQDIPVGQSLVERSKIHYVKKLFERLEIRKKRILLPIDHVVVTSFDKDESAKTTANAEIEEGWMGVDIGPKTIELYRKELERAKTVFWNGPMGVFEKPAFATGSFKIAEFLSQNSGLTIVGGGDSAAAAKDSGYADKMSHISTGGGASLEYLQGDKLPGLEVLRVKGTQA